MKNDDEDFLQNSKKRLDESVNSLDAATLSRLNQARQKALVSHRSNFFLATPAGAVLASISVAALVALLWTTMPQEPHSTQLLAQHYDDIDMLTSEADLELLEDLEFVSWLVEESLDTKLEVKDAG